MRRHSSKPLIFLGIAGIILLFAGLSLFYAGGIPGVVYGGNPGATLTITGTLLKNGQPVATWETPQGPLAIMFGNTRVDIPDGTYTLKFTPTWTIKVSNMSDDYTVKVTVTSVQQSWKGSAIADITPPGVVDTTSASMPKTTTALNLTCATRYFSCDTVINNPPAAKSSADYKITYNYKVELYVGGTLVDSKTDSATATATFTNTLSGTLSSVSVSVSPVTQFTPFTFGF